MKINRPANKKCLLFFTLYLLTDSFGFSQIPSCIWASNLGSSGYDWANSIAIDNSGSGAIYVAGPFTSASIIAGPSTIFNAQAGSMDVMLIKYDNNGNAIWATAAGSTSDDFISRVITDLHGNVYISGSFTGSSISFGSTILNNMLTGVDDGYLAKYNSAGILQWAISTGGNGQDFFGSMAIDQSGNLYVTGSFNSDSIVLGSYSLYNAYPLRSNFLTKINSGGNILWATITPVTGTIALDYQSNIFIGGNLRDSVKIIGNDTLVNNGISTNDIFIAKFDTIGNPLWALSSGGAGNDGCYALASDDSGNVYITGSFWGPSITFPPYTLTHSGGWGMYLVKYNTNGNAIWAKSSGGTGGSCSGQGMSIDSSGNIYVTGSFGSTAVSFGSTSLISLGFFDVFLVSYDRDGNTLWATSGGGNDYDYANALALDATGNVYIGGAIHSTVSTFGTFTLTSSGLSDLFLVKYDANTTSITENNSSIGISVFPNPFNSEITIATQGQNVKIATFTIRNTLGQEIFSKKDNNLKKYYSTTIELNNLNNGIYFLELTLDGERVIKKIIKEY